MFLGKIYAANIGQDISAQLHTDLHNNILHVEYGYLSSKSKGTVVSLFTHESGVVSNYLSTQIIALLPHFLTLIGATVLILKLNLTMGIYICTFLPLAILLMKYLSRNLRPLTRELLDVHARLVSRVEQDVQLNIELRTHNLQNKYAGLFSKVNIEQRNTAKKFNRASALIAPSVQILGYFTLAVYLLVLGSGAVDTSFSINELIKLILYSLLLLRPISSISGSIGATKNVISALSRISDFLSRREPEHSRKRTLDHCDFTQNIILENVSFRYEKSYPYILENCSLNIKAGEVVVLTGENGSGKSTLTALLLQLLPPAIGTISVGTTDLQSLNLNYLRSNISYVRQSEQLLDTTIRENLFHHPTGCSDTEIIEVLDALNMWDWIKNLPDKLDQRVGEQGILLSGGQAQKIALARTLLEKRKIIILDEATSMLDIETEKKFIGLFRNFVPDSTVIIIAHRPLSGEIADRHIELNDKTLRDSLPGFG